MKKRGHDYNNASRHNATHPKLRSPTYLLLAILAHIFVLFYVSVYELMDDGTGTHSIPPVHIDTAPSAMQHARSRGEISATTSVIDIDGDTMFIFTSVLFIILLCISSALELTWPVKIEELVIVYLIWGLVGNMTHPHHIACSIFGVSASEHTDKMVMGPTIDPQARTPTLAPNPSGEDHNVTNAHVPIPVPPQPPATPIGSNNTNNETRPEQDAKTHEKRTHREEGIYNAEDDEEDNVLGIIANSLTAMSHPCGWGQINVYFSLLCIVASLLSFLCDVDNRALSLFFRIVSLVLTALIFVLPIACNRFRMTSIGLLIIKITLYNIVWNMLRFKRIIQFIIEGLYRRSIELIQKYGQVFDNYDADIEELEQMLRGQQAPPTSTGYHIPRSKQQQQHLYPEEYEAYDDEEDDDDDSAYEKKRYETSVAILKSLSVSSPYAIFKALDRVHELVVEARKKQRRLEVLRNMPMGRTGNEPLKNNRHHNQQQNTKRPYERNAPQQILYFQQLNKVSKKYSETWCCSWKNRHYNERIIYLIDISRTIWILAICPFHPLLLFLLGFAVIAALGYYIRIDVRELSEATHVIEKMNTTHSSHLQQQ